MSISAHSLRTKLNTPRRTVDAGIDNCDQSETVTRNLVGRYSPPTRLLVPKTTFTDFDGPRPNVLVRTPAAHPTIPMTAEHHRLDQDTKGIKKWKTWGPYVSERQWATVREDYSGDGNAWTFFPHDHARSRAYRWGEDGLAGISDEQGKLCWSLGLWNESDPILKERLFGVTGHEGNHGEDVKELYYYLDSTVRLILLADTPFSHLS